MVKVLYEDNHIIAVYKPAGVLTQGDKSKDISLMDETKKYLKEKYHKHGNVFLGLVHRLDRPVSGIILFGKTSKGASRLSEQFRNREIKKTYQAILIGKLKNNKSSLKNYLKKEKNNKVSVYDREVKGSSFAELDYEVLKSNDKYSLVLINLKTGKPHQIRVQFSAIDCPVLGDVKYGAEFALADKSICLAETSITFKLAIKEEYKNIAIEAPESWDKFIY